MTRRSSLMEWLDQTKKLSKAVDYAAMDMIDRLLDVIWFVDRKLLLKNDDFFTKLCEKYHKPNPIEVIKSSTAVEKIFREKFNKNIQDFYTSLTKGKNCLGAKDWTKCPVVPWRKKMFSAYVEADIARMRALQKEILWQWFEVIDFMYERPELINPAAVDEYIESEITDVCAEHKKNNPLINGTRKRFGKYWKDDKGAWHLEKRNRF
jgi:hypothetical protein